MTNQEVKNIVSDVCKSFHTFGRNAASVEAPMFALGVDVESVVRFILELKEYGRADGEDQSR